MFESNLFSYLFSLRQHPIKILTYTTSSFWILLIPLARKLYFLSFDVATWFKGDWFDILIIVLIFAFAFLRWFFITFSFDNHGITTGTGYFGLLKSTIHYSAISSVSCSQGAMYRFFGCYKVCIDTNASNISGHDITLTIRKSDLKKLTDIIKIKNKGNVKYTYTPRKLYLVIFSFIFSSTLSGVVLLSTLVIQATRILGRQVEQKYLNIVNDRIQTFLTINLPPIAIAITSIIIIGWLYSFFVNLLRHWNFSTVRQGGSLITKSGFVTNRESVIMRNRINLIDKRQSFIMRMFNICSVNIDCAGYGKGMRQIPVIIPITTNKEVRNSLKILMPDSSTPHRQLKCSFRNVLGFTVPPLILAVLIPIIGYVSYLFLPRWYMLIRFVTLIVELPAFWLLVVKFASIFTTGIGFDDNYAVLNYCKWYQFHTVTVPIDRISSVSIYQTWFQRISNTCNIKIYTYAEKRRCHKIKNFKLNNAINLLKQQGYYVNF